ncbi:MAG TPA: VOC family protein [Paracoccaceae bacterium]|nr:VOC family protein [Paracoccaceae bacterium]HMO73660.1 VOC family protein [Paracoccaceae bacterium]
MIGYITIGADDMEAAERFYSAFLPALGYEFSASRAGLSYALPAPADRPQETADLYVVPPFDGRVATAGNGAMLAFSLPTQALVRDLHAAAVAAGGRDDGAPGFRAAYGPHFYVGYLRDPQGNKVALYCDSRTEPRRPD